MHAQPVDRGVHRQSQSHGLVIDGSFSRQVDVWATQAGLVVAGYYHANAVLDDQR